MARALAPREPGISRTGELLCHTRPLQQSYSSACPLWRFPYLPPFQRRGAGDSRRNLGTTDTTIIGLRRSCRGC